MSGEKKSLAMVALLICVAAGMAVWRAARVQPSDEVQGAGRVQDPGAEAQRLGPRRPDESAKAASAPSGVTSVVGMDGGGAAAQPAGERLRPGAEPTHGQRFLATMRGGGETSGTVFRAAAQRAPLLVFMGEADDPPDAWAAILRTLRVSRDYHLIVLTPPPTTHEAAGHVEATRAVETLEAALTWAHKHLDRAVDGIALIGGGLGGAAAALLGAERRDVLAVVSISAPARLGTFRVADAMAALRGRQTYWIAGADDERGAGVLTMAGRLPLAAVRVRPGHARGARLLASDRRAQTSLAGWLFAVMPTVGP
mgnify:CR=1 FL=1